MGTQGPGRKRIPNKERLTAEDDALNVIAKEAEARLAAKRAARAEAREIRMKELERQQKEIYQVQKKYYGLDNKWGDIEQWMEDSERYSRHTRRHASISDDEERMSVSSRGSVRSDLDAVGAYGGLGSERGSTSHSHKKSKKKKKKHSKASNGYDDDCSTISGWSSKLSDESRHSRPSRLDLQPGSLYEDSVYSSTSSRRYTGSAARVSSEYSGFLGSSSRTSSRASSRCASPVEECGTSVASFLRSAAGSSRLPRDLDDVTIPDLSTVDDRLDRDYSEKGSRVSTLSSATLASLDRASSRRGSGDTSITADTEVSMREIKDTLAEMEEKYRKAMVSNAQLDNEKCNLMYQVDIQKDSLMELEELLSETRREYEDKAKELEREKYAHGILQFQFNELKQTLKQSEELLTKHGIVLGPDWSTNGETGESLDGPGRADSDTKISPTEGSSVLGRSEEKQPGVVEAAEGSKPNQLDEAVPQNHVTPPSPSGPASVVETCQSDESEAPLIGNKEDIESGNTVTEWKNQCNDSTESVQSATLVNAGSEDDVTIEEKVVLEVSGSNLESSKPSEEVMGSTETDGQDLKTERELDQKVEAVCAGDPATEITCDKAEQINETDKSESGNGIAAGESAAPVPEIIISMANSDQPEETLAEMPAEAIVESSSSNESQQTKPEAEAAPVSEEETAEASPTPVKQPQQPQGGSASGKKKKKKKKGKQKQKGGAQDPKPQVENSLNEDPGQKTGEENSKEKAAGSFEESIQESPVGAEADSIAEERPETNVKNAGASEETENMPCLQTANSKNDRQEESTSITGGDSPTEINPESDIREHPTNNLESKPDMDSVSGHAECILNKEPIDSTEPPVSEDKDCCDSGVTIDDQNDTVAQSTKTNEEGSTEISVSESVVNTDESCQNQQVKVDDLPCNTPINAKLSEDLETQSAESKLNTENQSSGGHPDDTHDCLDSELSEQTPVGSSELLTNSVDAPSQLDGSESTETNQVESTLHSEENTKCQNDPEESLSDVGGNGTETQQDVTAEATEACIQSKEIVQPMASDGDRDPANQDQPAATAPSDDFKEDPRERQETNDPVPETKAEEDEEGDEVGEEFQFEDQDLEALPDSPKTPLTEKTDEEKLGSVEEENEEHGGQDKENNSSQEQDNIKEQNNVELKEEGEKTDSEKRETRQDPAVTGSEQGSAGEEPSSEGTEERETSGVQNNPATTEQPSSSKEIDAEQPSSSTEIEAQTTERGEVVSVSGDSEGASQVAETESGGQEGGPTRKDSKKGSKKNKGKGKEDCKMS